MVEKRENQKALSKARESEWVDYDAVMALKLTALRHSWTQFQARRAEDEQKQRFAEFIQQGGDSLRYQAVYDGLQADMQREGSALTGWPAWSESWRDCRSAEVQNWCEQHGE